MTELTERMRPVFKGQPNLNSAEKKIKTKNSPSDVILIYSKDKLKGYCNTSRLSKLIYSHITLKVTMPLDLKTSRSLK